MMPANHVAGAACYVYYRVSAAHLEQARSSLEKLLAEVRTRTGIEGTLSRRIDPNDGDARGTDVTVMEVYAGIANPAAFEAQLQDATQHCGLQRFLAVGARRSIEWFAPFPGATTPVPRERR